MDLITATYALGSISRLKGTSRSKHRSELETSSRGGTKVSLLPVNFLDIVLCWARHVLKAFLNCPLVKRPSWPSPLTMWALLVHLLLIDDGVNGCVGIWFQRCREQDSASRRSYFRSWTVGNQRCHQGFLGLILGEISLEIQVMFWVMDVHYGIYLCGSNIGINMFEEILLSLAESSFRECRPEHLFRQL